MSTAPLSRLEWTMARVRYIDDAFLICLPPLGWGPSSVHQLFLPLPLCIRALDLCHDTTRSIAFACVFMTPRALRIMHLLFSAPELSASVIIRFLCKVHNTHSHVVVCYHMNITTALIYSGLTGIFLCKACFLRRVPNRARRRT